MIPTLPTSVEGRVTDLVAEGVHHPTDPGLHEIEQPETSGRQIEGN